MSRKENTRRLTRRWFLADARNMPSWEAVIGLEVHIELATKSKMFCRCPADYFGHTPNSHVCPTCLGLPGALPVANKKAIESVVLTGLAMDCDVPFSSKFDRKNYFYPDLPKGYQISQYDLPFSKSGKISFKTGEKERTVTIRRVHLEEDTAKMFHSGDDTFIDFNRSGVPLMELVTEPEIRNAKEAKDLLTRLQLIIRYLGISDCDMEKGSMRLEANISVRRTGEEKLPDYKVEVKNLNSFRFVEKAIDYEINRQTELLDKGERILQETRGFNEAQQKTYSQRIKEEANDYRYFPEPDLPPISWTQEEIEAIKATVPELPDQKERRFENDFGLSAYQAGIIINDINLAIYFEEAARVGSQHNIGAVTIANSLINKRIDINKLLPADLVRIFLETKSKSMMGESDIVVVVKRVIDNNYKTVSEYQKGKLTSIEFLVGQVMKETHGQADATLVREKLEELLS